MKKLLIALTLIAAPILSQAAAGDSVMCSDETGKRFVVSTERDQNGINMSCNYSTCGFEGLTLATKIASNGISDTYQMSKGIQTTRMTVIFNEAQKVKEVRFTHGSIQTNVFSNCR